MRKNAFEKEIILPHRTNYKMTEKVTRQENTIKVFTRLLSDKLLILKLRLRLKIFALLIQHQKHFN